MCRQTFWKARFFYGKGFPLFNNSPFFNSFLITLLTALHCSWNTIDTLKTSCILQPNIVYAKDTGLGLHLEKPGNGSERKNIERSCCHSLTLAHRRISRKSRPLFFRILLSTCSSLRASFLSRITLSALHKSERQCHPILQDHMNLFCKAYGNHLHNFMVSTNWKQLQAWSTFKGRELPIPVTCILNFSLLCLTSCLGVWINVHFNCFKRGGVLSSCYNAIVILHECVAIQVNHIAHLWFWIKQG